MNTNTEMRSETDELNSFPMTEEDIQNYEHIYNKHGKDIEIIIALNEVNTYKYLCNKYIDNIDVFIRGYAIYTAISNNCLEIVRYLHKCHNKTINSKSYYNFPVIRTVTEDGVVYMHGLMHGTSYISPNDRSNGNNNDPYSSILYETFNGLIPTYVSLDLMIINNNIEMIKYLHKEMGAVITDNTNEYILYLAVSKRHIEIIKYFVEDMNIEFTDELIKKAVKIATKKSYPEIVTYLNTILNK